MFPQRLKELREKTKLSQVGFAEKLGIGATSIFNYENENVTPRIDVIIMICEKFNVSADWLLGLEA
jgi:transcriptional regulator with XRE-family HTH domain